MFFLVILQFFVLQYAEAAWPDSSEGRILAADLLRKDLLTSGNTVGGEARAAAYKKACDLKYYPACNYKTWTNDSGFSDTKKAGKFFSSRCKSDGLSCVVSGWTHGYINGKPSNKATNPARALADLTLGCQKKKYGPACAHLGELYMMGVGTNIDYQKAQALFQEACTAKDQYGCYAEADLYYNGWGLLQDYGIAEQKYSAACSAGFLPACTKLGQMIEYGQATEQSLESAVAYYQDACTKGYTQACVRLGSMYKVGRGVAEDQDTAATLWEKACQTKNDYGCYLGGDLYRDEWSPEDDIATIHSRLEKGCASGNLQACFEVGQLLELKKGAVQQAYRYYEQSCSKDNANGCFGLAQLQMAGYGGEDTALTALEIFRFLCGNSDPRGCYGTGLFFEKGQGVAKDSVAAASLYSQSCDAGYAKACARLGKLWLNSPKPEEQDKGFSLIERSCNFGEIEGCVALADLYRTGFSLHTTEISKDISRAEAIYDRACQQRSAIGCYQLAQLQDQQGQFQDALESYQRSCVNVYPDSCALLAEKYLTGAGVVESLETAVQFFEKACLQGHRKSCEQMAAFYSEGRGVAKDPAKALEKHQQACRLQSVDSCFLVGQAFLAETQDQNEAFRKASPFLVKGCELGNQDACVAAEPLLFLSAYEKLLEKAFVSADCQVTVKDSGPLAGTVYVTANQDQFRVFSYLDEEQTEDVFQAKYVETNLSQGGSTRTAQSYWTLRSADKEMKIEHHENWFFTRVSIEDFPGRDSFSRDEQDGKSIYYSRRSKVLRRYTESACRFKDKIQQLQAKQCSELQALIAAQLVSECSATE